MYFIAFSYASGSISALNRVGAGLLMRTPAVRELPIIPLPASRRTLPASILRRLDPCRFGGLAFDYRVEHQRVMHHEDNSTPGFPPGRAGQHRSRSTRRGLGARPRSLTNTRIIGLVVTQAGNVTAYITACTVSGGWTIAEVERLLFVRYLDQRRRLRS